MRKVDNLISIQLEISRLKRKKYQLINYKKKLLGQSYISISAIFKCHIKNIKYS